MKKFIKNIALATVAISTLASCENYLDVNKDPNNPLVSDATPDLLLAGVQKESYDVILSDVGNDLGNIMMQNWAGDVYNFTGAFQNEFALNLTTNFYQTIWNTLYLNTGTYTVIAENEDPAYSNYNAIARIMKVYYFQYLVDLYGDIPYTEAHQFGDILTPVYDDDEAIYGDFISQLDTAISLIENPTGETLPVGDEDVMMGGDMSKWVRFANTLKLRILLRQESTGIYNSDFASLAGASFITSGDDVTINPGYTDVSGKQNPFYAKFFQVGGTVAQDRRLLVGAQYAIEFLKGASTEDGVSTGVSDPRISYLYELTEDGMFVGVQQGENTTPNDDTPSRIGPGLVISSEQDGYILTAAESYFLQAEAITKGYIAGDAAEMFRQGIRESFRVLGTPNVESYIAASENVNRLGWTGSSNKMLAIMTQKWIALNGINGLESWIEYTRTGFPNVPLTTIAQRPNRPYRLLYPTTEYTGNSANVPQQATNDAFTTHVFWGE